MLHVPISTQPDDETCGPTCLHAIYQYYGLNIQLNEVIQTLQMVKTGGTTIAHIAEHALERKFDCTVYVYNLNLFDPSWFDKNTGFADTDFLIKKLTQQTKYFKSYRDLEASQAYINMLKLGGKIRFNDLNSSLLTKLFKLNVPIITGLSATFLYHSSRERTNSKGECIYDDIKGDPCGHFVVLCGKDGKQIIVADPHRTNPISNDNYYEVNEMRLINAILLGVLTYDANLLLIEK